MRHALSLLFVSSVLLLNPGLLYAVGQDEPEEETEPVDLLAHLNEEQRIFAVFDFSDPNFLWQDFLDAMEPDPEAEPLPPWQEHKKYYHKHHHPQVTPEIYQLLCYPYYPGGLDYVKGVELDSALPEIVKGDSGSRAKIIQGLETCVDMIHRWRSLNEEPAVAVEVVRAVELTRISTNIYTTYPKLAIAVRRTLGQLGRTNRNFDQASRIALQMLLKGHYDKTVLARNEKIFSDFQTLLDLLADQNDQITIALGIGPTDRKKKLSPLYEKIDYSNLPSPIDKPLENIN